MTWTASPACYRGWTVLIVILSIMVGGIVTTLPDGKFNAPILGLFITSCMVWIGRKAVGWYVDWEERVTISDQCLTLSFVRLSRNIRLSDILAFELWVFADGDGSDQLRAFEVLLVDGSVLQVPKRDGLQMFVRQVSRSYGIPLREHRDPTKWTGG